MESAPSREEQTSRYPKEKSKEEGTVRKASNSQPLKAQTKREAHVLKSLSEYQPEKVAGKLNSDPEYVKDVQGADPEAFLEVFHRA